MPETAHEIEETDSTSSLVTYFIETYAGFYRINVPSTWIAISENDSRNGYSTLLFKEGDSVRQTFNAVLNFRKSGTPMQRMEVEIDGSNQITEERWVDIEESQPISTRSRQYLIDQARRRNQANGNNQSARGVAPSPFAEEYFDDDF